MAATLELIGERIRLRSAVASDTNRLLEIRSTPEVRRWWRGDDIARELEEDFADDETHHLCIDVDGGVVGLIQFAEEPDPEYWHASIDIYIDPALHRQGFATEAIRTLVAYLFDVVGHHRLTIDPAVANGGAVECYRRVGFREVGIMRSYERCADGSWADGLLMELLAADFAR